MSSIAPKKLSIASKIIANALKETENSQVHAATTTAADNWVKSTNISKKTSITTVGDTWTKSTNSCKTTSITTTPASAAKTADIKSQNLLNTTFKDAADMGAGLRFEIPPSKFEPLYKVIVTHDPLGERGSVAKLSTVKNDTLVAGGSRSQLVHHPLPMGEYTYKVGFLIPEKFHSDKTQDILAEWHNTPDFHKGEQYNLSPSLAFSIINNRFILERRWDANPVTLKNPMEPISVDLGPIIKGKWQDFQFHINWHHTDKGYTCVHQNGKKIYEIQGPNAYNDDVGPYFKTGVYKWKWAKPEESSSQNANERTVYVSHMSVDSKNTVASAS